MIDTLSTTEIEDLLKNELVGRIGCHFDGITYVIPTSYAYDNNRVYVHSTEGMKIEIMRKNENVCFQVDNMRDMANWKSVVAWGTYKELTNKDERLKALQLLISRPLPLVSSTTTHLGENWPFSSDTIGELGGVVFCIELTKKTGRFERNEYPSSYK